MTNPAPNRPLWELMHCAWSPHRDPGQWRLGYAAELRAIAERLADKQAELSETGHAMSVDEAIRWLGYEADRAEAGG